jgi:hypothetical protein
MTLRLDVGFTRALGLLAVGGPIFLFFGWIMFLPGI